MNAILVDDDIEFLAAAKVAARAAHDLSLVVTNSALEALAHISPDTDLLICDVSLGPAHARIAGANVLQRARELSARVNLVMASSHSLSPPDSARAAALDAIVLPKSAGAAGLLDHIRAFGPFRVGGLFATSRTELEPDSAGGQRLILDAGRANRDLIDRLQREPDLLQRLDPRKFEELVADLLSRMGYEVQLTPPTRDGGFDLFAARSDLTGRFLYLVECKRYAPPSKVGVKVVRALNGVVDQHRANGAMVVTSTLYTAGARQVEEEYEHRLKLHDYLAIQRWLQAVRE